MSPAIAGAEKREIFDLDPRAVRVSAMNRTSHLSVFSG
jgi:hypothetical protein